MAETGAYDNISMAVAEAQPQKKQVHRLSAEGGLVQQKCSCCNSTDSVCFLSAYQHTNTHTGDGNIDIDIFDHGPYLTEKENSLHEKKVGIS